MANINWYPGHMARASLLIRQQIKNVDLILQVVDARAIQTCQDPDVKSFSRPVLTIAVKSDLSSCHQHDEKILIGNSLDKKFRGQVLDRIERILSSKKQKLISKGLINPTFCLLVVGLPNVGKSQLINLLSCQKKSVVQNKPGITRKVFLNRINDHLFVYDTPGVMFKKITSDIIGYKLALIKCIKREILPMDEVVKYGYEIWTRQCFGSLQKEFNLEDNLSFDDFLKYICVSHNFFLQKTKLDLARGLDFLYELFTSDKLGKINYDQEV